MPYLKMRTKLAELDKILKERAAIKNDCERIYNFFETFLSKEYAIEAFQDPSKGQKSKEVFDNLFDKIKDCKKYTVNPKEFIGIIQEYVNNIKRAYDKTYKNYDPTFKLRLWID